MLTLVDSRDYADLLEATSAFSGCTRDDLEAFVAHGVVKVQCAAGTTLATQTLPEQSLYVLASGSALLHAGDGVVIDLEPGDYFGSIPERHHHFVATVVASSDVEVLVVNPLEAARLGNAASRGGRNSRFEWRISSRPRELVAH
jgi:CRP-like cAMP-binding protein